MGDAVEDFFKTIEGRHEPLLEKARGSIRIELDDDGATERWYVAIDDGDVDVSHRKTSADCRLRSSRATFRSIVLGEANAMATVLRGAMTAEGDLELLLRFQRLLPGPPKAAAAQAKTRRSRT